MYASRHVRTRLLIFVTLWSARAGSVPGRIRPLNTTVRLLRCVCSRFRGVTLCRSVMHTIVTILKMIVVIPFCLSNIKLSSHIRPILLLVSQMQYSFANFRETLWFIEVSYDHCVSKLPFVFLCKSLKFIGWTQRTNNFTSKKVCLNTLVPQDFSNHSYLFPSSMSIGVTTFSFTISTGIVLL